MLCRNYAKRIYEQLIDYYVNAPEKLRSIHLPVLQPVT